MNLTEILKTAVETNASDVHLVVGLPPILRVDGEIVTTPYDVLTDDETDRLILENLTASQRDKLVETRQLCYSLKLPDVGYFRVTIYHSKAQLGASIRVGSTSIRPLEDLGLPSIVGDLARRPAGLVLITGPTGSGKTTTLNAMIDQINRERRCKIITVEDPIEYLHSNKRSVIVQQEVGTDARTFDEAIVHILRQDPNVIGVGEMRDLDTITTALTAAETGHLVLSTLHTPNASETVNRIVDVFPAGQQNQVRQQLSSTLLGIVAQQLLPRIDRAGRVVATEVLVTNEAVRNIIREGKIQMLPNTIRTGRAEGMLSIDDCLRELYQTGVITYDTAANRVSHPDLLRGESDRFDTTATDQSRL